MSEPGGGLGGVLEAELDLGASLQSLGQGDDQLLAREAPGHLLLTHQHPRHVQADLVEGQPGAGLQHPHGVDRRPLDPASLHVHGQLQLQVLDVDHAIRQHLAPGRGLEVGPHQERKQGEQRDDATFHGHSDPRLYSRGRTSER